MPILQRSALVPYTHIQMYALVDNIEAYPTFLPWCKTAQELKRNSDEVQATLTLAYGGFEKSFTTLNRLQPNKMIEIKLVHGPFQQLEGFWRFEPMGDKGCRVSLDLEFEFSNKLIAMAFGPMFKQVTETLVNAFCKQAEVAYGSRSVAD
jgi:ribosome-associated toxin RatA of RatAB toxin-antitoxin module